MLEVIAALCIACLATLAIRGYLRARGKRLSTQRFYRDRFYDIAERIYNSEALSDDFPDRIRAMVDDLDDPRMFGKLWRAVCAFESQTGPHRDRPNFHPITDEAVRREWVTLLHSYLMAVSYYRGFRGILVRATLARALDPETIESSAETINWRIHKWPLGAPLHAAM
jgi:hypothetical protein